MRLTKLLFAGDCLLCSEGAGYTTNLCDACYTALPKLGSGCPTCARVLPTPTLCSDCYLRKPAFSVTRAPYEYAKEIKFLIGRAKFESSLAAALTLGELLANWLNKTLTTRPDLIIPVPLHASRLRHRGYNQAQEMARTVSRHLGVEMSVNACARIRNTQPQSEMLGGQARQRNVRGAFHCKQLPRRFASIALVDDVMTTGATLRELAAQLSQSGIKEIQIWVVERTISYL
jgi:ComF family protein